MLVRGVFNKLKSALHIAYVARPVETKVNVGAIALIQFDDIRKRDVCPDAVKAAERKLLPLKYTCSPSVYMKGGQLNN
jgi:hypothetical protein